MRTLQSRIVIAGIALLIGSTAPCHAQEVSPPDQITVDGERPLRLLSQARRTHLLGTIDLYNVALYGDGDGGIDTARLARADVAKALRIDVRYEDDLSRRVAVDWRHELIPRLEPQSVAHLRGSFAPLRKGDAVQIEYVPEKGTTVRVNRGVAVPGAHHDLMLAFLDHWLGNRPVSEAIKRALLAP